MTDSREQLDHMVRTQLETRDVRDPRVLEVFRTIDRARFVSPDQRASAYGDYPLALGHGQTISQPYIVALMTQELDLLGRESVLEIGTGSGYQTAALAHLAAEVYTIEVHAALLERARMVLDTLGYRNVHYRVGDGRLGWPEAAPFDRILCAAAAEDVPGPWIDQLADGGILVAPVGGGFSQTLVRVEKRNGHVTRQEFCPCRFVPLVGGDRDAP
ncbi:MAG: protein-L-isoaspartate(D-aspartate) O-methyltransferase [Planctomycetes bacterium]|nr:protein-L-isoaspartate(D-aspartate) O-methyltransferase [Planctomycetota bacterium]